MSTADRVRHPAHWPPEKRPQSDPHVLAQFLSRATKGGGLPKKDALVRDSSFFRTDFYNQQGE